MNFDQLEAFVALLECGSFHAAAERLGISQPTVTQRLQRLEAHLGCLLVERARSGCLPTPQAERLFPHATALLRLRERARASVEHPRFVLGASSNIGSYLLAPALDGWMADSPVATDIQQGPNPEIYQQLERGRIDAAFTEWWDHRPGLQALSWRREPLLVILPPDHPLGKEKAIDPESLVDEPFLGGEAGTGTGRILKHQLGALSSRLRIRQNLGSTQAVLAGVKAGWGLSIVFESAARPDVEAGTLLARPVAGHPLDKELFYLWPEGLPGSAPALRLRAFLRAAD